MNDSFRLGSVFGITIRVHVLFLFMMGAIVFMSPDPTSALAILLALFGLVFLHELGHSLVAQSFGIRVVDITFWPLGGMARMSDIPESPRIEGLIAIAGPAVNFALAGIGFFVLMLTEGTRQVAGGVTMDLAASPLKMLIGMNLVLGGFNLVPAFPMDGGRVLRAWLGRSRDWVVATDQAVRVGRFVAILMAVAGLFYGNCMLVLIAGFVWWIGMRELMAVRLRHGLSPFAARRGFSSNGPGGMGGDANWSDRKGSSLFDGPPDSLSGLFEALVRKSQGRSLEEELEGQYRATRRAEPGPAAAPPQEPDARRPEVEIEGQAPRTAGFSEEEIRELERFKGRLRKPPS